MKAEVVLPCGCHKVCANGHIFTSVVPFYEKGKIGRQYRRDGKWKLMKPSPDAGGYLITTIHDRTNIKVHRLVACNFFPNPLAYPEVQHRNDKKKDNRAENLKWGSQIANAQDRENNGGTARGTRNGNAKLTYKQAREIRALYPELNMYELARRYKVSRPAIAAIIKNLTWREPTK